MQDSFLRIADERACWIDGDNHSDAGGLIACQVRVPVHAKIAGVVGGVVGWEEVVGPPGIVYFGLTPAPDLTGGLGGSGVPHLLIIPIIFGVVGIRGGVRYRVHHPNENGDYEEE